MEHGDGGLEVLFGLALGEEVDGFFEVLAAQGVVVVEVAAEFVVGEGLFVGGLDGEGGFEAFLP